MAKAWETGLPGAPGVSGCVVVVERGVQGEAGSTFVPLVVFEGFEGHEGAGTGDELVAELGLVVGLLDVVVVLLGVV